MQLDEENVSHVSDLNELSNDLFQMLSHFKRTPNHESTQNEHGRASGNPSIEGERDSDSSDTSDSSSESDDTDTDDSTSSSSDEDTGNNGEFS